ncbi:RNA-binding protein 7 isoform X1 [Cucumis sativus]|uniref:RNA-binding protein 7 isoform X1 n=1 Tax=Cucumis sativus TaxID=3659 RepID=UPI0012F4D3B6|nr:RNA-binding protein 7 isoform X1 [Cucumis sativus]
MSGRSNGCTIYIGNLDEKVSDRVLYDILIQAGRVVDLHIPRDKESGKPKGFAFAEYESEEIANYAVKLFSGLVNLHKRTLKFAVSGQDKPSPGSNAITSSSRSHEISQYSNRFSPSCRFPTYPENHLEALSNLWRHPPINPRNRFRSTVVFKLGGLSFRRLHTLQSFLIRTTHILKRITINSLFDFFLVQPCQEGLMHAPFTLGTWMKGV